MVKPGGAFYLFPKAPWGTGTEFVAEAIRNNLLIIPGSVFSRRDTHFRISYAADDATLDRGIEILNRLCGAWLILDYDGVKRAPERPRRLQLAPTDPRIG